MLDEKVVVCEDCSDGLLPLEPRLPLEEGLGLVLKLDEESGGKVYSFLVL